MPSRRRTAYAEGAPVRSASTSAERVADGDAEAMRKQGKKFAQCRSRVAERNRCRRHLSRGKDSKTLVLAAFFPPFLSPQKEREPRSAQRSAEYYGLPHQRRRSPARNDRVFCKGYSARPSGGVGAPRPTAIARSAGERAYYWWCSAAGGQRRPPLRTSGWMPPWAAGQKKRTPGAFSFFFFYRRVSTAWPRRGWNHPAAAGAASPRPFPYARRK